MIEILKYSFKFLDKLNTIKEKEKGKKARSYTASDWYLIAINTNAFNSDLTWPSRPTTLLTRLNNPGFGNRML